MDVKKNPSFEKNIINDIENVLHGVLFKEAYEEVIPLNVSFAYSDEPVPFSKIGSLAFKGINPGESWSKKPFGCAWFHLTGKLPQGINKDSLCLSFDCNGEALLVDDGGEPLKGFTNGSSAFDRGLADPKKQHYELKADKLDEDISFYLDAGSNDLFGNLQNEGRFLFARIDRVNNKNIKIAYDIEVLLDFLKQIDSSSPYYKDILDGLIKIRDLYWYHYPDAYEESKPIINKLFLLSGDDKYEVTAVGHSHLDLAWLWPLRETKRKVLRTFSNVFYLLERYPSFVFAVSQPQQLSWLKELSPKSFERVVRYEKEGRIELVGGGFVESDTNCVGEEALVRQMLYGQKFYKENFGHYTEVGWLPDTFGYVASLPTILLGSEQRYFMTTKISWNTVNLFPYHNFIWEGLDGSKVLTHLPPEGTYNSGAYPRSTLKMEKNFVKSDEVKKGLMVYGIGDGGGGPSIGHLERIKRQKDIAYLPFVTMGHAKDFFKDLLADEGSFPVYKGELYLENHQGTYTSQSRNKVNNRHFEEKLSVMESVAASSGLKDKQEEIDGYWREMLLYEFHDILPGSSIKRVYDESDEFYASLEKRTDDCLSSMLDGHQPSYHPGDSIYNPSDLEFDLPLLEENHLDETHLEPYSSSSIVTRFEKKEMPSSDKIELSNIILRFSEKGFISSIIDKRSGHDVLAGQGNALRVFIDHGDAWNIMDSYRHQPEIYMALTKREISSYGPYISVKSHYVFKNSSVDETVLINAKTYFISFHHDVNWSDTGYMLHSCFALASSSKENTFDVPFGFIKRSALNETSIQKAQFEVASYKWCDVSNEKSGVSFINKTRNGCYAKGNLFEFNLLRSTNYPCKNSDHLPTSYDYAIYIHDSPFDEVYVDRLGNAFNAYYLYSKKKMTIVHPQSSSPNVAISSFKLAYKKDGYIIRLYERSGHKTSCSINHLPHFSKAYAVDLLEEVLGDIDPAKLSFSSYEVKTIWIIP